MTVYLVKSTDGGAPSLTGQNGSGVTVFDYVLNTVGGLTIQDTATNKRNYVLPNGDILFCAHDNTISGQTYLMTVRACESASSITTRVDEYPLTSQVADNACNFRTSSTADATARPWWAILDTSATTGCFYFFSEYASADYVSGTFWAGGTLVSCLPTDNYAAVLYTRAISSTSAAGASNQPNNFVGGLGSGSVASAGNLFIKRSADGAVKSTRSAGTLVGGNSVASGMGGAALGPDCPSPTDGKIRQTDISITDFYSQSTTPGSSAEQMRMYLPRLFQPLHKAAAYGSIPCGTTWADSSYGPTAQFIFFKCGGNTGQNGALIVQYNDDWVNPSG